MNGPCLCVWMVVIPVFGDCPVGLDHVCRLTVFLFRHPHQDFHFQVALVLCTFGYFVSGFRMPLQDVLKTKKATILLWRPCSCQFWVGESHRHVSWEHQAKHGVCVCILPIQA